VAAALLGGCAAPPSRAPLDVHVYLGPEGEGRHAVVLLPGRCDEPLDFARHGFVDELRRVHPEADVFIPYAHLSYYLDRSIVQRLREDVFRPLRARGYRRIDVVGVSMGGLGALLYLRNHPSDVDGLMLIAPYLGDAALMARLRAADSPAGWAAVSAPARQSALGLSKLWGWLGRWPDDAPKIPVRLGFGRDDRFAPASRMLAEVLPEDAVLSTDGGHRWVVWRRLWHQTLSEGRFPGDVGRHAANRQ